jgi:hypothetical protein
MPEALRIAVRQVQVLLTPRSADGLSFLEWRDKVARSIPADAHMAERREVLASLWRRGVGPATAAAGVRLIPASW